MENAILKQKFSLKNNFRMKHCNISRYLFPFEGVQMQCVTFAYSFALPFLNSA